MVCVVVERVGVELHGWVGVGGDALRGGEGGVVTDEEPALLALEGCAGDLGELGTSDELGHFRPGYGPVLLVRECHLLS